MAAITSPPTNLYSGQPIPQPQDSSLYSGQQATLPIQTQTQTVAPTHDPLFEALKRYITSGPHAAHVASNQLREAFNNATEDSSGRAGLESFLSNAQPAADDNQIWEHEAPFKGQINISKIQFDFNIGIDHAVGIPLAVHGKAMSVFAPWSGPVEGRLYYNNTGDLSGDGTYTAQVNWAGVFSISLRNSRNEPVASFVAKTRIPISHERRPFRGTCGWAQ